MQTAVHNGDTVVIKSNEPNQPDFYPQQQCPSCGEKAVALGSDGYTVTWCSTGHVVVLEDKFPHVVYQFGCLDREDGPKDNDIDS